MLRAYFDRTQSECELMVTETTSFAKITWLIKSDLEAAVNEALKNLGAINARDSFELLLDAGEEQLSVICSSSIEQEKLNFFLRAASEIDEVSLTLAITKRVHDERVSVYFIEQLASYLNQGPLTAVLQAFSQMVDGHLQFEVFGQLRAFSTATVSFFSTGGAEPHIAVAPKNLRVEKLDAFRINTNASGLPGEVLPSDFYLTTRSELPELNKFFDEAAAVLSLAFLANTSELREPDFFTYKLYGYKAVVCREVPVEYLASVVKTLHEIYAWAYEGGSPADKLGLVRNVVSLHLDENGQPKFDGFVRDAINSNYQIYLKGNIQSYLEIKNKMADLLLESVERTSKVTDDVMDSFKNNVFIVVTFLLTVVVINGLKDSTFAMIFSSPYLLLVVFLTLCSGLWMYLVREDAISRYDASMEAMEGVLRNNYDKFLMAAEIDAALQPTLDRNQRVLTSRIQKYSRWWFVMLGLFLTLFVSGNFLFVQNASSSAQTAKQAADMEEKKKESSAAADKELANERASRDSILRSPRMAASASASETLSAGLKVKAAASARAAQEKP